MLSKWCAYFNEFPVIYGIATILDPGVKAEGLVNLLEFYYGCLNLDYNVHAYIEKCKSVLGNLYDHYSSIYEPQSCGSAGNGTSGSRFNSALDKIIHKRIKSFVSSSSSMTFINEYLSYQHETDESFQIVKWWQSHNQQFAEKRTQGLKNDEDEDYPYLYMKSTDGSTAGDDDNDDDDATDG
ncbi:hypothetical protein SOVF_066530 [Spinacia oleracea]|nr:hypothetical protein SOVF_066530 [Spinacia oleracea]